jgi:CubicO group peptidase (beta-lactamase class C family)
MATPDRLFRVGSTSKPLTAVTVMRLVQDGRLKLDDRPFVLLSDLPTRAGLGEDPRLARITVRDLL